MKEEAEAAQQALVAKLTEKGVKASVTDSGISIDEILASAQANVVSAPAGTIVRPEAGDLKALAEKAMSGMTFPTK